MTMRWMAGAMLAIQCFAQPGVADETGRAKEAVAVFRLVSAAHALTQMQDPPAQCQYDRSWERKSAIPEDLARTFFGLKVHSELSAVERDLKLQDILDPRHQHPMAFCTKKEQDVFRSVQLAKFENDKTAKKMLVRRINLAFPVFDESYTKAAVVVGEFAEKRIRRLDGTIVRDLPEAVEIVHFLKKTAGGWRLVGSEILGQT